MIATEVHHKPTGASFSTESLGSVARRRRRAISILVVTDMPQNFEQVLDCLRAQMFNVTVINDGWRAYHQAQALLPNVVLIDAEMSTMDNLTICRLMQRVRHVARVHVILASRGSNSRLRVKALETGAADCLSMPFLPEELMLRIAAHRRIASRLSAATLSCFLHENTLPSTSPLVTAALDLIEQEPECAVSVKNLANRVGAGERWLATLFKAQMGVGLAKYLIRKKMEAACRLLATTSMPIREVAAHAGFRSPCNFSVAFLQHMGMSPSGFRRHRAAGRTEIARAAPRV